MTSVRKQSYAKVESVGKDYRPLVRQAIKKGWTIEKSRRGGHALLRSPDGLYAIPIPGSGRTSSSLLKSITKRVENWQPGAPR